MERARKIFVATLLTGLVAISKLGAVQAGDYRPVWKTMKPLYAVSFDVGHKHVLSYFLSRNGLCKLTMMVTERPIEASEGNAIQPLKTARFNADISSGKSARFDTHSGKTLEYACATGAQTMTVRKVNQLAVNSPGR